MTHHVLIVLSALSLAACSSATPAPVAAPISTSPAEAPAGADNPAEPPPAIQQTAPAETDAMTINARLKLRGGAFSIAPCGSQSTHALDMSPTLHAELSLAYSQLMAGFQQTSEDDTAYPGTFSGRVVGERFELSAWHRLGGEGGCEREVSPVTGGHGTEPFWTIRFDEEAGTADFRLMDPPEERTYRITSRTEGDGTLEFTLELNGQTTQAVFTRQPSGDGMADELHPYQLIFNGWHGCGDIVP